MNFDFPNFTEKRAKQAEQFETRCVKTIHNTLFPNVPWSQVVRFNRGEPEVKWIRYMGYVDHDREPLPRLQFLRDENAWNLELRDLLSKKITSYSFYKEWQEDEYDAVVFLCVGTPVVCMPVDGATMFEIVDDKKISFIAKPGYAILKLTDYAELLKCRSVYTFERVIDEYFDDE